VTRLVLLSLALATACGSTVQVSTSGQVGGTTPTGDGLTAQSAAPAARGTSPGGSLPGAPTAVAGGARTGPVSTLAPTTPGERAALGPLTIGVLYTDNGAANAALGVATDASTGTKAVMDALVAGVNRRGGLAGRKVVATYYAANANASDYSAQASAACSYFTQDHKVPVVLDLAYGNKFGMAACLAAKGVVDIGLLTSDAVDDESVGLFAAPSWLSSTRRYPAVLEGLHASGYLTSANKVGVLLEDCPHLQRSFDRAVLPAISRLGLTLAATEHLACATGFSSAAPASASVQSAALRFRSRGVDRILMVSDFEQVTLLLMANYAQSQGWHPGYVLTSQAQTEVMRANIASGQWPQLHGVGWAPGLDIDDPRTPLPAADRQCLDTIKQGGVAVSGWQNTYVATTECSLVQLLGAGLRLSGGDATGRTLMAAISRLGSSWTAPGIVSGRTAFGPHRHEGPAAVRPFAYADACACLRYTGPAATVP
jgi:hypothetical protein